MEYYQRFESALSGCLDTLTQCRYLHVSAHLKRTTLIDEIKNGLVTAGLGLVLFVSRTGFDSLIADYLSSAMVERVCSGTWRGCGYLSSPAEAAYYEPRQSELYTYEAARPWKQLKGPADPRSLYRSLRHFGAPCGHRSGLDPSICRGPHTSNFLRCG